MIQSLESVLRIDQKTLTTMNRDSKSRFLSLQLTNRDLSMKMNEAHKGT